VLTSYTITPKTAHPQEDILSSALTKYSKPTARTQTAQCDGWTHTTCFEKDALQVVSDETAVDSASELMCIDAIQNGQIVLNLSNQMRTLTICREEAR
jgi:hypothetical protein